MINFNIPEIELFQDDRHLFGDILDFLLDSHIGEGCFRTVYNYKLNKNLVIKIGIRSDGARANIREFETWNELQHISKYKECLAPCVKLSNCGRILLQEKTIPISYADLPKKIPYFIGDTKTSNWGKLKNKIVCHDYANNLFMYKEPIKFRKPFWKDL